MRSGGAAPGIGSEREDRGEGTQAALPVGPDRPSHDPRGAARRQVLDALAQLDEPDRAGDRERLECVPVPFREVVVVLVPPLPEFPLPLVAAPVETAVPRGFKTSV